MATDQDSSSPSSVDYTLYFAPTPNGKKIALIMEELQLSYKINPIRFSNKDQFTEEFKSINPNSKIPAIIDHTCDDLAVFESGAILEYLADKTGNGEFFPTIDNIKARYTVKQWLYWQMAGFGPMLGQIGHFYKYASEDVPYAKNRYLTEGVRLFEVLDAQLAKSKYIAGEDYSIADMATYFWSMAVLNTESIASHFSGFENVKRWQDEISKRPAVERVNAIPF